MEKWVPIITAVGMILSAVLAWFAKSYQLRFRERRQDLRLSQEIQSKSDDEALKRLITVHEVAMGNQDRLRKDIDALYIKHDADIQQWADKVASLKSELAGKSREIEDLREDSRRKDTIIVEMRNDRDDVIADLKNDLARCRKELEQCKQPK